MIKTEIEQVVSKLIMALTAKGIRIDKEKKLSLAGLFPCHLSQEWQWQ